MSELKQLSVYVGGFFLTVAIGYSAEFSQVVTFVLGTWSGLAIGWFLEDR